jgi:hypothetical protein
MMESKSGAGWREGGIEKKRPATQFSIRNGAARFIARRGR